MLCGGEDGGACGKSGREGRIGVSGEVAVAKAPTSCGKNGHGAIMFLLGFISKRVINYTSKYNDDDEGYDDIIYYWIYIHTYSIYVYIHTHTIPIVVCDCRTAQILPSSVHPSRKKKEKKTRKQSNKVLDNSHVHYRSKIAKHPILVLIINLSARIDFH